MPLTNPCENLDKPCNNTSILSVAVKTWPHIANVNVRESPATDRFEPIKIGDLEENEIYI